MSALTLDFTQFIQDELHQLEEYDAQRPAGHPYAFHEHVQRVANAMRDLATAMNHPQVEELYLASLAHDAGKRLLPVGIWDTDGKPSDKIRKQRRRHTTLGVKIVDDTFGKDNHDPFLDLLRDLMQNHHEAINGTGWLGKEYDDLSLEARMLCVCDAFDGYSVWRPHFKDRDISPKAVIHRMEIEKEGQFDAEILNIFKKIKL
ncbi:MAG TPA: HD domain-containing protein [Alphaproteobacteria bacterium]